MVVKIYSCNDECLTGNCNKRKEVLLYRNISFFIAETKIDIGSAKGWDKLKSGVGWIALDYATRI